jgi:hypothetical protein
MVDTLDDVEPPYRSGDSDRVLRHVYSWLKFDDAKRRIEIQIDGRAADNVAIDAVDILVIMREVGRLTAELAEVKGEAQRQYDFNVEQIAKIAALETSEREKVAAWMIKMGFATGHGDTIEDLLSEATWQIESERENDG